MKNTFTLMLLLLATLAPLLAHGVKMKPLANEAIQKSCTECHFVYQAGFLPKRSWERLFSDESLKDHFGEEIVMEESIREEFLKYYLAYASDVGTSKSAKKINRSINLNTTPMRISTSEFAKDKHQDLDKKMFKAPKIESAANCVACHRDDAKKGIYDEDEVDVPGYQKGFLGWSKK